MPETREISLAHPINPVGFFFFSNGAFEIKSLLSTLALGPTLLGFNLSQSLHMLRIKFEQFGFCRLASMVNLIKTPLLPIGLALYIPIVNFYDQCWLL